MFAAQRSRKHNVAVPSPVRRRAEPKSLALLVDVVLARYGILPLNAESRPEPARRAPALPRGKQTLLFPVG